MKKAVVSFSGGQDSTTCLLLAKSKYDEVHAVSFFYGQKNKVELECAKEITKKLGVTHKIIDVSLITDLVDTPYVKDGILGGKSKVDEQLPSTWVVNRNLLFATLAHQYAVKIGADALFLGVNAVDYSGYPDCRPKFIRALKKVLKRSVPASNVVIKTPLLKLSKADIWNVAKDLGYLDWIINETHTCYNGDRTTKNEWGYGCGECDSCRIRKEAYYQAMKGAPRYINSLLRKFNFKHVLL